MNEFTQSKYIHITIKLDRATLLQKHLWAPLQSHTPPKGHHYPDFWLQKWVLPLLNLEKGGGTHTICALFCPPSFLYYICVIDIVIIHPLLFHFINVENLHNRFQFGLWSSLLHVFGSTGARSLVSVHGSRSGFAGLRICVSSAWTDTVLFKGLY